MYVSAIISKCSLYVSCIVTSLIIFCSQVSHHSVSCDNSLTDVCCVVEEMSRLSSQVADCNK